MSEKGINNSILVHKRIKDSIENEIKFKKLSLENILDVDNNLNVSKGSTTETKYSHSIRDTKLIILVAIRYLTNSQSSNTPNHHPYSFNCAIDKFLDYMKYKILYLLLLS